MLGSRLVFVGLAFTLVAGSLVSCAARVVDNGERRRGTGGTPCSCPTCCSESLCPTDAPIDGETCSQLDLVCAFQAPDACPTTFTCASGTWKAGPPVDGSACLVEGQSCAYAVGSSCNGVDASCSGSIWHLSDGPTDGGACCDGGSCCTTVICPASPPTQGAACGASLPCNPTIACPYAAPCDPNGTLTATCPSGTWQLDAKTDCGCVGATHGECKARPACRWIGPACTGMPTVAEAMCEPLAGCSGPSDCPDGTTCTSLAVDPCPGGQCGSCSIVAPECIPTGP